MVQGISVSASVFTLVAIAVDRYRSVFFYYHLNTKQYNFLFQATFTFESDVTKKAQSYKFMRKYLKKKITVINVLLRALIHIGSFTANWH